MKIPRPYLYLALAVYLVALVATIPANLFTGVVNRKLSGVTVSELQGSIWSGRIPQLYISGHRLEDVGWHLQPWALFLGRLQLGLDFADRQNRLSLSLARSFSGTQQIRGLSGQLSVNWLQGLTPYSIPVFKGSLLLEDVDLIFDGRLPVQADGVIRWRGAAVDLGQPVVLGQLHIALSTRKQGVQARITETSGRLDGDASLSLDKTGAYHVQAKLKPTSKGADLSRHLALVMQKTADGGFQFNSQGRLPLR